MELFDCDVLEMPWNETIGGKPEAETIFRAYEKFKEKCSSEAWDKLKNWYTPPNLEQLSLSQGRIAC